MKFKYDVITNVVSRSQIAATRAFEAAQDSFENEKNRVIDEFENSPITRELLSAKDSPESAENISKTLTGYPGKPVGNLFSFIGFPRGEDVITPVKEALLNSWTLLKTRKNPIVRGRVIRYNFTSKVDIEQIEAASPLPFENGSWIRAIERGISGVTNYLAGIFGSSSRSGGGIQIPHEIAGKSYTKTKYLFGFINDAIRRMKG